MKVRRISKPVIVIGLGVLLVSVLLIRIMSHSTPHARLQPLGFTYTDAAITAALIDGVAKDHPKAGAQIGTSASGGPDLYVKNRVAFVVTVDPSHANGLCKLIARMYDPKTGWALPLTGAIVMSGGKSVAICARDSIPSRPPSTGGPNG
jgi:hypothetical protein